MPAMGYRGKLAERQQARRLRRTGLPLAEIAALLGVSKSSVSLWVRDVPFDPLPRPARGRRRSPNSLQRRKQSEIDRLVREGQARIGRLSEREFLVAGVALYAGEGSKGDGSVLFTNSDPRLIVFFCSWLRHFFPIDESRLRVRLYLHQGLDLDIAIAHWSRADRDPRVPVREAVPGSAGPLDPPRQACAWLRRG
jgi:DNA-binding transcriptional MerR regulator